MPDGTPLLHPNDEEATECVNGENVAVPEQKRMAETDDEEPEGSGEIKDRPGWPFRSFESRNNTMPPPNMNVNSVTNFCSKKT